jgi:hypothetical protein
VFSTERLEELYNGSISLYRGDVDIVCVCVCVCACARAREREREREREKRESMLSSFHKFLFGWDCNSGPKNFSPFVSDIIISIFKTEKFYFLHRFLNCL